MRTISSTGLGLLFLCSVAGLSRAEVVAAEAGGFVVRNSVTVSATPPESYARFLEVGGWWDPGHTWSGESDNLSIDARAGGCFCESLPDGGSVEHMRVVYVAPGSMLRMSGGLGPLQDLGAAGALTWTFVSEGLGCVVTYEYKVAGWTAGGLEGWAGPVDSVLSLQLGRLRDRIEGASHADTPQATPR